MKDTDLAYLAGILDISGFVGVLYRKDRGSNYLLLVIARDSETIPRLFSECFGGRFHKSRVGKGYRWAWTKRGKAAQAVLRELLPYMHCKRAEIERYLALNIRNRGGQRIPRARGGWNQLEVRA